MPQKQHFISQFHQNIPKNSKVYMSVGYKKARHSKSENLNYICTQKNYSFR